MLDGTGRDLDRKSKAIGDKVAANLAGGHGAPKSTGLNYVQGQEFLHIGKSLVDQVVAGQSPLRALTVEGGRIVQAFGSGSDGVGGTFKALGSILLNLASPAALVAGGVLAIGAAAVYAATSFDEATKQIKLGLLGIGAGSNASIADVRRLGDEIARTQGISTGAGRDVALGLAKTGAIDKGNIAPIGNLTRGYANLTGTDLPTAGAALADIFSDPAKGAERMNAVLGTLDARTRDYIRSLQAQNRQQDAVMALVNAATPGIARAAEQTGFWASAWARVATNAANADEAVRRAFAPTDQETLVRLQKQLDQAQKASAIAGPESPAVATSRRRNIADLQTQIDKLKRVAAETDKAQAASADAVNLAKQSDVAAGGETAANPAAQSLKRYQETVEAYEKAINTPGVGDKLEGGIDNARATLDGMKAKLAELRQEYEQGGAAAAEALKEADYRSKTGELTGYAKAVADARHETEKLVEATRNSGDAASQAAAKRNVQAAGDKNVAAIRTEYESKPSSYAHSVTDAPKIYQDAIYAAAEKYAQDPNFLASILSQESGHFRPDVVSGRRRSSAGAIGIAQFMPGTAAQFGIDPTDPLQSIDASAHYLSNLKKQFKGSEQLAAAAYNAGPGTIKGALKDGGSAAQFPAETRDYLNKVFTPAGDPKQQLEFAKSLDRQYADQKSQVDALSQSQSKNAAAVIRAQEVQKLYDQAVAAGLPAGEETRKLVAARADGFLALAAAQQRAQASNVVREGYAALGRTDDQQAVYEQASQHFNPGTADFKGLSGELTNIQQLASAKQDIAEPFHSLTAALVEGKSAADALKQSVTSLLEKGLDKLEDSFISSLFSPGAGATSGVGGGLFAGIGKLFGFADGGRIGGPGTGRSDSILARVSAGEYVVNAKATKGALPILDAINSGRLPRFADGGMVLRPVARAMSVSRGGSALTNAPSIQIDARGSTMSEGQIRGVVAQALQANNAEMRRTQFTRAALDRREFG